MWRRPVIGGALALRPEYPLAHLGLAAALRMQRRAGEAEASCQAALAVDPNCVEALTLLVNCAPTAGSLRKRRSYSAERSPSIRLSRPRFAASPRRPR